MMSYIVLPNGMRDNIPLLGLQTTVGHGLEPHESTVVEGSLERREGGGGGGGGYDGNLYCKCC